MIISSYQLELQEDRLPQLVCEKQTRYQMESKECFNNAEKIQKMMVDCFRLDKAAEEYLYLLCLDASQHLLGVFEISHGIVDTTFARPREIFLRAILCGAVGIILVHNHPSGECKPSQADLDMTKNIHKTGDMMGIQLLDHIVIGKNSFISLGKSHGIT